MRTPTHTFVARAKEVLHRGERRQRELFELTIEAARRRRLRAPRHVAERLSA